MRTKTINFKDIKDNNFILSPSYYLENKKTQQRDRSKDLSPCVKCKILVEDKDLYSKEESEKEYCFNCFYVVNENKINKKVLVDKLKRIRSECSVYYPLEINRKHWSWKRDWTKEKIIDTYINIFKKIENDIWDLEKALKIKK